MKEGEKVLFERVKELCSQNGITFSELERILKFGNGTIRNWDKVNPSIEKVKKVAEYFSIGVDELLSETKIPTKEARDIAIRWDGYTDEQKNLVRCYMSLIENGKAG